MTRWILFALLGAAAASTEFISRCEAQSSARFPLRSSGSSSSRTGADANYVTANYSYMQDPFGTSWQVQNDGSIQAENGNQGHYGRLLVNGLSFSPSTRKMLVGGGEFLHSGKCGLVDVARTMKFDMGGATARFVDVFTNNGTTELKDLGIAVQTTFRNSNFSFQSELGNAPTGPLEPRAGGIVGTASYQGAPIAAVFLATPRAKTRPVLSTDRNQSLQATYRVTIPAGGSVAVVTGMRLQRTNQNQGNYGSPFGNQQQAQNDPKAFAEAMAPLREKTWLSDVPREVRRKLINYLDSGSEQSGGGLPFKQLEELIERSGLSATESDMLLIDDGATIAGTAAGGPLTITTAYGKSEVPLDDVAAMIGGGGQERKMQLYLRTGEILGGTIETGPLTLTSAEGLKVELLPSLMHLLVLKNKKDVAPEPPPAYLTTATGDRLGVRIRPEDRLTAATPWGGFSVAIENVESLAYRLEPQPMMHLTLRNRTQLPVFLTGPSLDWDTTRYGKLPLPNHSIRRWDRTTVAKPKTDEPSEEPTGGESTFDAATVPHLRMSDDAIVFGTVVETQLRISTPAGVKTVDTRSVFRLERRDDGDIECDTVSSPIMFGRIENPLLTVTVNGMRLRVPSQHVQSFRGMPAEENPFKK